MEYFKKSSKEALVLYFFTSLQIIITQTSCCKISLQYSCSSLLIVLPAWLLSPSHSPQRYWLIGLILSLNLVGCTCGYFCKFVRLLAKRWKYRWKHHSYIIINSLNLLSKPTSHLEFFWIFDVDPSYSKACQLLERLRLHHKSIKIVKNGVKIDFYISFVRRLNFSKSYRY
jgi:hypothetical protein